MKLHILSCFHGRQKITKVFLAGIERLQKEFDISYSFVASKDEDVALNNELGFTTYQYTNNPISNKFNYALSLAMKEKWDYLMIMGSDDLISNEGVAHLLDNSCNYKGFGRIVFHNTIKNESILFTHDTPRLVGCGRMISRDALEMVLHRANCYFRKQQVMGNKIVGLNEVFNTSFKASKFFEELRYGKNDKRINNMLWREGLDSALDNSSELNLAYHGFYPHKLDRDVVDMVDIKSYENVTDWADLLSRSKAIDFDFWFLSEKERSLMQDLYL